MRLSTVFLAAVMACVGTASSADEEIIKGVYLKSKALCAKARKDSLQTVIDEGNLVLSNKGIDAIEYNCAFVQVLRHPRLDNAWIATAFCEQPGVSSPDVFSILRREPGQLEISSLEEGNVENAGEDGDAPAGEDAGEANGAALTAPSDDAPAPEDEVSFATTGGTYYLCDGVSMP